MSAHPGVEVERVDPVLARSRLTALRESLRGIPAAVVAFSGGADSSFLAYVAHRELGERSIAVTADSPSLPRSELRAAAAFARASGLAHRVVVTNEVDDPRYARNGSTRCFFCKAALMEALDAVARSAGGAAVLVGVNVDDLGDHRPGHRAIEERGGRLPLVEAGLSKAEVRWLSRELGLSTWDKPAAACLSSRIAYGVPVTVEALSRVERAEEGLRSLGLWGRLRVRDHGEGLARIEVEGDAMETVMSRREEIVAAVREAGFRYVTVDLEGYRSGSHNLMLTRRSAP